MIWHQRQTAWRGGQGISTMTWRDWSVKCTGHTHTNQICGLKFTSIWRNVSLNFALFTNKHDFWQLWQGCRQIRCNEMRHFGSVYFLFSQIIITVKFVQFTMFMNFGAYLWVWGVWVCVLDLFFCTHPQSPLRVWIIGIMLCFWKSVFMTCPYNSSHNGQSIMWVEAERVYALTYTHNNTLHSRVYPL